MTVTPSPGFGPWAEGITDTERTARLRAMRALVLVLCGPQHPLGMALRSAESGDQEGLQEALATMDRLPTVPRRRLLATFAALHAPDRG